MNGSSPAPTKRIIIGLVEHMGDIVACEPVARYLKFNNPTAHLAWVVDHRYRELIDTNFYIDETIAVSCLTEWMRIDSHGHYDQVVDLHVNYRTCEHCQIPLVKRSGNPFVTAFDWFDHGALLEAFSVGAGLPRLAAQPQVYIAPEHANAVDYLDLPAKFCVIHRQSNNVIKDWTDDGWRAICATIRNELGLDIVEVGAGRVGLLPRPIDGVLSLVNRLPILQTAEVIRRSSLFFGIDSGPAHLANALRIPGVILLGTHGYFKEYLPYTGFYASASPLVKIVRNRLGPVADLTISDVADAVRYVVGASRESNWQFNVSDCAVANLMPWDPPREPRADDITATGLFDLGYYAVQYPEVMRSPLHPVDHYLTQGAAKAFNPGPDFDAQAYKNADNEIGRRGINPLLHYIDNGRSEGRLLPPRDRGPLGALDHTSAVRLAEANATISRVLGLTNGASDRTAGPEDDGLPRTFAFYLPQFHPIPENDWAHGPGFSEWHNVIKTKPLFAGHHQPRVPGELGFYDLRSEDVLRQQMRLALKHGISGFCFYYYYFQGQRLLFRPLENFLNSDIDAPFMCLWANENWTRRWDGGDNEVIVKQNHSRSDDILVLRGLLPLFSDRRYVRVRGRPILMVYKTHLFPDIRATVDTWREEILRQGFPGLFLVMVDDWTSDPQNPREIGFDASYEIPSNITPAEVLKEDTSGLGLAKDFTGKIVEYPKFAQYHLGRPFPPYRRFRTVMLPWDNTPRYGSRAIVHVDGEGESYKLWLLQALIDTYREHPPEERMVFLHSWNEWCEGTYLEPDRKNGRFFLEQTAEAINLARQAIGLSKDSSKTDVIVELLKLQKIKDSGAYRVFASARTQVHYAWRDLVSERAEAARRQEDIVDLSRRIERVEQEKADMERRLRQSDAYVEALRGSTSWRVTRPLRGISSWLRGR